MDEPLVPLAHCQFVQSLARRFLSAQHAAAAARRWLLLLLMLMSLATGVTSLRGSRMRASVFHFLD